MKKYITVLLVIIISVYLAANTPFNYLEANTFLSPPSDAVFSELNKPIDIYSQGKLVATLIPNGSENITAPELPLQVQRKLFVKGDSCNVVEENRQALIYLASGRASVEVGDNNFILDDKDVITVFGKSGIRFEEDSEVIIVRQTGYLEVQTNLSDKTFYENRMGDYPNEAGSPEIIRTEKGKLVACRFNGNSVPPSRMWLITPNSASIGIGIKVAEGIEEKHTHLKDGRGKIEMLLCKSGRIKCQIAGKYWDDIQECEIGEDDMIVFYSGCSHGFSFEQADVVIIMEDQSRGPDSKEVQVRSDDSTDAMPNNPPEQTEAHIDDAN